MKLWPHHERAIASLVEEVAAQPESLVLLLGGSLVRGWGTEASDLDGHLVVTDEAMAEREARNDLVYTPRKNHCDYEGGYVDLKVVSPKVLREAAEHASEPFRNAYVGVEIVWCRDGSERPQYEDVFRRIATYPEAGHAEKVMQFACHLRGMHWYVGEAAKRDNAYLMLWCAQRAVMLACRLVLAHHRVIYPYHKWLLRTVAEVPGKPAGFMEAVEAATRTPSTETVRAVADLALGWQDWGAPEAWWNPWISRSEWAWRIRGRGALGIDEE